MTSKSGMHALFAEKIYELRLNATRDRDEALGGPAATYTAHCAVGRSEIEAELIATRHAIRTLIQNAKCSLFVPLCSETA